MAEWIERLTKWDWQDTYDDYANGVIGIDKLVETFAPLIDKQARKFWFSYGLYIRADFEDIISEYYILFLSYLKSYDTSKGSLSHYFFLRSAANAREVFAKYRGGLKTYSGGHGKHMSISEIMVASGLEIKVEDWILFEDYSIIDEDANFGTVNDSDYIWSVLMFIKIKLSLQHMMVFNYIVIRERVPVYRIEEIMNISPYKASKMLNECKNLLRAEWEF